MPRYDDSEWPLVKVQMPPVALSAEAFQAHLDECSARYTRGDRFCLLIDMGSYPPFDAVMRRAVAERMTEDARRYPGRLLGCAIVSKSERAQGNVTAINWVAKPPYRFAAFESVEQARAWLTQLLRGEDSPSG